MTAVSLAFPVLSAAVVVAICAYLLIRGVTHLFVILFAVAAILHALPSAGFLLLQQAPGGISAHLPVVTMLSIFGMLGTLASLAAFFSLASFLLAARPPES